MFSICVHRHKQNGSPEPLWIRSNTSTMLILQLQPQVMKNKAGTVLWKAYSPDLSGLWCFPLSLPLYLSCPDVMLITVLFFTALFSLLLLLCNAYNASEAMVALRFSVCFPHEFYDGFFFLNVLNSSWAFIWKEIRGECWPYVSIPVWPSPTAWMKKRIWKKKRNLSRNQNLTPLLWSGN